MRLVGAAGLEPATLSLEGYAKPGVFLCPRCVLSTVRRAFEGTEGHFKRAGRRPLTVTPGPLLCWWTSTSPESLEGSGFANTPCAILPLWIELVLRDLHVQLQVICECQPNPYLTGYRTGGNCLILLWEACRRAQECGFNHRVQLVR